MESNSGISNIFAKLFDIRVLGVIAQIVGAIVVALTFSWFIGNVAGNLESLGEAQFICEDGTVAYRCAYDFMDSAAQFDVAETSFGMSYDNSNSYWRAIGVAAVNTIRVTIIGCILTTILGTLVGIARLSKNWLVANVSKWYVDLFRNTPLVLQLVFIYFSFFLALPSIKEAAENSNFVFLSNRGINYPSLVPTVSFQVLAIFIGIGLVLAYAIWIILGRREERLGGTTNRGIWAPIALVLLTVVGWFVANASAAGNQVMLVNNASGVTGLENIPQVVAERFEVDIADLAGIQALVDAGDIDQKTYKDSRLNVCAERQSLEAANIDSELRALGIPYSISRVKDADKAFQDYAAGKCDLLVAEQGFINEMSATLEDGSSFSIVGIPERPLRLSLAKLEGLNFAGGGKMTPEFAAILIGLVLNTGASVGEIVRAGIQAVSKGQTEAARAIGLTEGQRLRLVVLPQALRVIIPPLTSSYLNLAKNSTLAQIVAFPDFWTVIFTTINQSGRAMQGMLLTMLFYLTLSLIISAFLNWYNQRVKLVER